MVEKEMVWERLREVTDPDLNINIVDLGLIYDLRIEGCDVFVRMTLTTPACPFGDALMEAADREIRELDDVDNALNRHSTYISRIKSDINEIEGELTFEPSWEPEMMSEEAREELGALTGRRFNSL
ncbi:MAG: metal-sulfur cluster assembly factor [Candidatus Nanohaloarchaea archaeon]|nr:metal-sulfur cluster assembly factor [Candidatus Nanohaloarchaea archaeon]